MIGVNEELDRSVAGSILIWLRAGHIKVDDVPVGLVQPYRFQAARCPQAPVGVTADQLRDGLKGREYRNVVSDNQHLELEGVEAVSDIKLGVIVDETAQRDAIHIAVAPVVASQILAAGDHIGLLPGSADEAAGAAPTITPIGIVDPFLREHVQVGQRFYMWLYPQTVTGMRHHWAHPAFDAGAALPVPIDPKAYSERWLRDFAERIDLSYNAVIMACQTRLDNDDYYIFHGHDTPDCCYEDRKEMWKHFEIVTGRKVDDHETTVFSCLC